MKVFELAMPWLLVSLAIILVFVSLWTFDISNKLVGPFERILRELDEINEGKKKGPLKAREGDEMFDELLKRINKLLEKLH